PLQAIKGFIAAFLESAGLRKMTVVKARLEIRRNNGPDIEASGVNVEMALAGGEGIRSVRGSLSVGSLRIAGTQAARQLSAEFQGDTSAVTVTLGKGVALDGRVKAECSIDITRARLSAFTLSTKNSDIGMISSWTDTTNGYVTGRADIKLSLDSSALLLDSLHGSGTLQVANASLMRFPFQKTIASMFAFPHFRAPRFSRVEGVFAIKPGGVLSSDMRGAGDTIIVTTSGWIKANGTLSEKITCEFTRAGTKALTPFMRKTLDETRGGGRSVRIRIYGKTDHPKVEIVSKQVLEKAVQNMFDDVKSNLQQWLR
ncbi:MAG: hypothetical protein JXA71_02695, partial [Chitinispirillaceae bacterium]|nr:hypothetical protein [Chitinispirillaceae bacterium]